MLCQDDMTKDEQTIFGYKNLSRSNEMESDSLNNNYKNSDRKGHKFGETKHS